MITRTEPGLLAKIFTLVIGAALLVLGFMFSVVVLTIVVVVGLGAWGYFGWRTRALRKAMREHPQGRDVGGEVIDGEVIVVEECRGNERIISSREPPGLAQIPKTKPNPGKR